MHNSPRLYILDSFSYTHDMAGNRLTKIMPGKTVNYSYDTIYRLTGAASLGTLEESYTYDSVCNRFTSLPNHPYAYNAENQLTNYKGKAYNLRQ